MSPNNIRRHDATYDEKMTWNVRTATQVLVQYSYCLIRTGSYAESGGQITNGQKIDKRLTGLKESKNRPTRNKGGYGRRRLTRNQDKLENMKIKFSRFEIRRPSGACIELELV